MLMSRRITTVFILFFTLLAQASPVSAVSKVGQAVEDGLITANVKAAFTADEFIAGAGPAVKTIKQVVYLKEVVPTRLEYNRAKTLAETVEGVKQVNVDALKVLTSEDPIKDAAITAQIKTHLAERSHRKDDIKFATKLHVETKNGIVYLLGEIPSAQDRDDLLVYISEIDGVQEIKGVVELRS